MPVLLPREMVRHPDAQNTSTALPPATVLYLKITNTFISKVVTVFGKNGLRTRRNQPPCSTSMGDRLGILYQIHSSHCTGTVHSLENLQSEGKLFTAVGLNPRKSSRVPALPRPVRSVRRHVRPRDVPGIFMKGSKFTGQISLTFSLWFFQMIFARSNNFRPRRPELPPSDRLLGVTPAYPPFVVSALYLRRFNPIRMARILA